MKQGIHPEYHAIKVSCTCGNEFETRSAVEGDHLRVDICSACHPFYAGRQKILDIGSRMAKFEVCYSKRKAK